MHNETRMIGLVVGGLVLSAGFVLAVGGLLVLSSGRPSAPAPAPARLAVAAPDPPNILLLIADDVGVDKITSYAEDADPSYRGTASTLPQTPTIDGLAAAGLRFTDAWASPKCSPTRAAMYSGQHGFRNGIGTALGPRGVPELTPGSVRTIAEVLSEEGYSTGLFGKWHLGEGEPPPSWASGDGWSDHLDEPLEVTVHPLLHGWDRFSGTLAGELDSAGVGYTDWIRIDATPGLAEATQTGTYATAQTVQDGLDWASEQRGPWMMTMAFHAPHTPLEAPPDGCSWTSGAPSGDAEVYRAMLECLDIQIAELLSGLADAGALHNTLIAFVGDNGTVSSVAEGVFADGRGKGTLYESGVRVPLILAEGRSWLAQRGDTPPGTGWGHPPLIAAPGSEIAELVHGLDLYATFSALAGAAVDDSIDSVSLLPLLQETDGRVRESVLAEEFDPRDGTGELALRVDDWKMIVKVVEGTSGLCRANYRLYDLHSDRFEQVNRQRRDSRTLEELIKVLDGLMAEGAWFDVPDCT